MHRTALAELKAWKDRRSRKPIVIWGARQVGKSTLVELFAKEAFHRLFTLNFEKQPELVELFVSQDPPRILKLLAAHLNTEINPGKDLLFLDEIQAAPSLLSCLRYFYEELPELHVIAAGSLLEFALREPKFSMPVGRIEYLYLGPMQFEEFLLATGKPMLRDFLKDLQFTDEIPAPIHHQLSECLATYFIVGGMPASISAYVESGGQFSESEREKQAILETFQDDFAKYGEKINIPRLRKVFRRLPHCVGQKFKYVHIDPEERSKNLKESLSLLFMARLAEPVYHSASNASPLAAEINEKHFKLLFLDVGLLSTALDLNILNIHPIAEALKSGLGAISEQFVGQHLLYGGPLYQKPSLFYWMREKANASAEVDYVVAFNQNIIPIEVKAGKAGRLRSLHLFIRDKKLKRGVRFNLDCPSVLTTKTALNTGNQVQFQLISLPLYLIGQLERFLTSL